MMKKIFVPAATGIAAIDEQHAHYYKLINDFLLLSKERDVKKAEAVKFFAEVVEYTVQHFDSEEFFMRSVDYPDYDNHIKIHNRFRGNIEKQSEKLEKIADISKFAEVFAEWVSTWFSTHEATADLKLAQYCKEHNIHG